ncbi:MAG: DUF6178 family protein [Geobacteraceae bacterium]|nr:DUF6178 family protein [Geobacteraceae bacterium]
MTKVIDPKKAELTLIRGGRTDAREFARLSLPDKISRLRESPAKKRLDLLIGDPEGERLAQALQPQELYLTFKEIGAVDALELLMLASPEQLEFFLDMELWERDSVSQAKALEWLGYLLEAGEEKMVGQLPQMDLELLILVLFREIAVGGGVGELLPDEERTADWDHSFDNLYFITFKNPKHARLIGTFLDIVFRRDRQLYQALMEGVKNEVESELEEEAYAFRTGRLADLGFPSREEAVSIYFRIDPGSFVPASEKKHLYPGGVESLPVPLRYDSLLARTLRRLDSEELLLELNYLINNALVAEETQLADGEAMQGVMERVSGYIIIALEFLGGDDEAKAADILERESFKRLFQLGNSIVQGVKKKAEHQSAADYPTGKALNGIREAHPRFYRGLDPDGIDGYREFAGMGDVRKFEEFLERLGG